MAKLVTGLAMLYLMQDKRHKLHAICYLDEALALDGRNQASLIETAHEFGFFIDFRFTRSTYNSAILCTYPSQ
ncbi:MAG: hypothetical protein LRY63_11760 [Nitrincola sp.]|nr:hypothetical protein [Nitrincola sp.]